MLAFSRKLASFVAFRNWQVFLPPSHPTLGFVSQKRTPLGSFRQIARSLGSVIKCWNRTPANPGRSPNPKSQVENRKSPTAAGFVCCLVKSRIDAKIQPNIKNCFVLCLNDVVIEFGFVRRISSIARFLWSHAPAAASLCSPTPPRLRVLGDLSGPIALSGPFRKTARRWVSQLRAYEINPKPHRMGCTTRHRARRSPLHAARSAHRAQSRLPKRYAIFVACAFYVIKIGEYPGATIRKFSRAPNMTKMQEKHAVNSLAPLWGRFAPRRGN